MKLVSICPSNTELAVYAGLGDYLIGVDDYSDWPENTLKGLPRLGPDLSIDINKVAALKPDLVLASQTVPGMEKNIEGLKEQGIPYVIVPNPKTFSDIGKQLLWLGEETGKRETGLVAHDRFYYWLEKYKKLSEQVTEHKTVYWEWWGKPVFTPGKQNWLTEMTELAGGKNIFSDYEQASVKTDWEDVYNRDPDVIGVIWVGVHKEKVKPKVIKKRPQWEEMRAIVNGELHILDEPYFCRPSPRLLIGLMQIAAILHPNIYPAYSEGFDPMEVE
ncbi:cobalamin-binding protein [Salipaludibacillus daqingensis]|uniref:cobalamin-binding protein n=1 Tax=Salipaludibacillus daqingensis TaxID=3041001 RepID=UPI0024755DF2|nr:cobalamin-binding protein [Salipaludibacillus daqingensis]